MTKATLKEKGYKREKIFRNKEKAEKYNKKRNGKTAVFKVNEKFEVWRKPKNVIKSKDSRVPDFAKGTQGNRDRIDFYKKNKIDYKTRDNKTLNAAIENWLKTQDKNV